jgi:hypothetical protein
LAEFGFHLGGCSDNHYPERGQQSVNNNNSGLPDFSWYKISKREKIYQITTNYIKCQ